MAKYTIDRKRFVSEQFEQETVIINLEEGLYYSLSATATETLNLVEQGFSVEEIVDVLRARYINKEELPGLVESFVAEIERQGILIPRPERFQTNLEGAARNISADRTEARFDPPVITRFDDMQEILLLDPIHQVSEQGWPNQ
jgi:hypothetical protein